MEDEIGIVNVMVTPDLYNKDRLAVTRSKFSGCRRSASEPGQNDPR
jgi:hypothetical protein